VCGEYVCIYVVRWYSMYVLCLEVGSRYIFQGEAGRRVAGGGGIGVLLNAMGRLHVLETLKYPSTPQPVSQVPAPREAGG
jgi:hypothetical protein